METRMFKQTISLFRYLLLGILNRRLYVLLAILLVVGLLLSSFIMELAIINSEEIALALLGDFLRYCLVFLALLLITTNVAEDYESRQFERLLAMPISRWQYIAAQCLVIVSIAVVLCLPVLLIIWLTAGFELALYWSTAVWLEIILVGLVGLLAILSLEKIPLAVFFSLAIYLLAKFSTLISQMLSESVELSDKSLVSQFTETIFQAILHVIPRLEAFAQNDVFFESMQLVELLSEQFATVAIYSLFLLAVCLVDFYRKEFNL